MHRQQHALSEDSRDGLRQCRHECIYASRLNKIKETPAHTRTSGAASSRGETGEGDLKTQLETAAEFPPRILPGWEHYPKPVPRANFIAPSDVISLWETILFHPWVNRNILCLIGVLIIAIFNHCVQPVSTLRCCNRYSQVLLNLFEH